MTYHFRCWKFPACRQPGHPVHQVPEPNVTVPWTKGLAWLRLSHVHNDEMKLASNCRLEQSLREYPGFEAFCNQTDAEHRAQWKDGHSFIVCVACACQVPWALQSWLVLF